ncbi:TIGR02452 family protein [Halomonas sp. LBP4]|uniref:TIGR02452 family protein n=1 Tax=Halomonas sp. LBP4 TaxID=2044917 RepID=UPI000D76F834|nr:TIGR02452 family protein [Halomonas sp. LBP4]
MSRKARAKIASETLEILEEGRYAVRGDKQVDISGVLQNCLAGTRHFGPHDLYQLRDGALSHATPDKRTTLEVINESTLSGASSLCDVGEGQRVGVLNFASARKPGGGFLGGSQAQEESLARSSGLYSSLLRCPEYYEYHRTTSSLLYSHRVIYSPGCPIFRNDTGDLLPDPYQVDFLTCPAPNAGAVRRHQPWHETRQRRVATSISW